MLPVLWGHKRVNKLLFQFFFWPDGLPNVYLFSEWNFHTCSYIFLFEHEKLCSTIIIGGINKHCLGCSKNQKNTSQYRGSSTGYDIAYRT